MHICFSIITQNFEYIFIKYGIRSGTKRSVVDIHKVILVKPSKKKKNLNTFIYGFQPILWKLIRFAYGTTA